jgi:hypothetical protein
MRQQVRELISQAAGSGSTSTILSTYIGLDQAAAFLQEWDTAAGGQGSAE